MIGVLGKRLLVYAGFLLLVLGGLWVAKRQGWYDPKEPLTCSSSLTQSTLKDGINEQFPNIVGSRGMVGQIVEASETRYDTEQHRRNCRAKAVFEDGSMMDFEYEVTRPSGSDVELRFGPAN
jgi:hypothetical protein